VVVTGFSCASAEADDSATTEPNNSKLRTLLFISITKYFCWIKPDYPTGQQSI